MAGVKAPLMSLDASGTIGKAFTFSRWKGRSYVRRHAIPSNPKTVGQMSTRAVFKYLTQVWASLDAAVVAYWETLATADNVTGLNAMVRACMSDWALYGTFSIDPSGAAYTDSAAVPDTPTQTAVPKGGLLGFTENAAIADGQSYIIEVKEAAITAHEPIQTRAVLAVGANDEVRSVTITGLTTGTVYDWGIVTQAADGTQGAFVAGGTFTPE
jgi:hypothetical protein